MPFSRRQFLSSAAAVAAAGQVPLALAKSPTKMESLIELLPNVIHTANDPGRWKKKAGSHLPDVSLEGSSLTVKTHHGMSRKHYIVRHLLVLDDGSVLGSKTYASDDKPEMTITLPENVGGRTVLALSFCNRHDLWASSYAILG